MSQETETKTDADIAGLVLVVDDNSLSRALHRELLAQQFDVLTAASGAEAIALCRQRLPDLILLDIEMPGQDGIETCRELRTWTTVPIIFITGHDSLEEHVRAYDAGGDDTLLKPVQRSILLRKVALAIGRHRAAQSLSDENVSLQRMAMNFLSSNGASGTLLDYMRTGVGCRNPRSLAEQLLAATRALGVECSVMLRHPGGPTILSARGDPTPLEHSIFGQLSGMGRLFQFGHRLVVNYERVSIIVVDMPDEAGEAERAGQIRDNITILAETTQALIENVDMRLESMRRAEQLQVALSGAVNAVEVLHGRYLAMLGDTRILLHELVEKVEKTYSWAGFSAAAETRISEQIDESVRSIIGLLAEGSDFEQQFEHVLLALRGGSASEEVELF